MYSGASQSLIEVRLHSNTVDKDYEVCDFLFSWNGVGYVKL